MYALTNSRIYTGYEILNNHAVIVNNDKIETVCPEATLPIGIMKHDLAGQILAPGFIDLQINGCGGVQFNDSLDALTIETLEIMHQTNLKTGCTSFLPTLVTSSDEFIRKAVTVMHDYLKIHHHQALGLHIEGPFISKIKKGIHNEAFIRPPTQSIIDFLCDNAEVIKILTLAPEAVPTHFIRQLTQAGIHVSVGHSNADYATCYQGIDAGIRLGTHLFNAMSSITGREPGVVGAIYDAPDVYVGIIADGMHVHWANVRNSYAIKKDKLILVSDAILLTQTNMPSGIFAGKTIYNHNGKFVDENGTLGGSSLTMIQAVANSVNYIGVTLDEALRMASLYPARAIGVDNILGSICDGNIANFVVFDDNFAISKTIVNGILDH